MHRRQWAAGAAASALLLGGLILTHTVDAPTPYPDSDTFTGTCATGGTAATQGNEALIPTPMPLTPCAPEVCNVPPLPSANVDGPLIPCPTPG